MWRRDNEKPGRRINPAGLRRMVLKGGPASTQGWGITLMPTWTDGANTAGTPRYQARLPALGIWCINEPGTCSYLFYFDNGRTDDFQKLASFL
jgi:hypothetical protein